MLRNKFVVTSTNNENLASSTYPHSPADRSGWLLVVVLVLVLVHIKPPLKQLGRRLQHTSHVECIWIWWQWLRLQKTKLGWWYGRWALGVQKWRFYQWRLQIKKTDQKSNESVSFASLTENVWAKIATCDENDDDDEELSEWVPCSRPGALHMTVTRNSSRLWSEKQQLTHKKHKLKQFSNMKMEYNNNTINRKIE